MSRSTLLRPSRKARAQCYIRCLPLAFDAGDSNFYRYVGNNPTNATDPRGLYFQATKVSFGGFGIQTKDLFGQAAEDYFFTNLALTRGQRIVLDALRKNAKFQRLWNYLSVAHYPIELKVTPGLKAGNKEIWGGFDGSALEINPNKKEALANPLELAETIVHEVLHAILRVSQAEFKGFYETYAVPLGGMFGSEARLLHVSPVSNDVRDIRHDVDLNKLSKNKIGSQTGMSKEVIGENPALKDYCDKHYGDYTPPKAPPRTTYVDINDKAQEIIVSILTDLLKNPDVKKVASVEETWSFHNLRQLQEKQKQK